MMASDEATFSTASTRTAAESDARWRSSAATAVSFHGAHGSAMFHRWAITVCSGARARATRWTSSSAARNSGDPYVGGGAGRKRAAESSNQPRDDARLVPIGGTPRALYHIPGPVGIVPFHT